MTLSLAATRLQPSERHCRKRPSKAMAQSLTCRPWEISVCCFKPLSFGILYDAAIKSSSMLYGTQHWFLFLSQVSFLILVLFTIPNFCRMYWDELPWPCSLIIAWVFRVMQTSTANMCPWGCTPRNHPCSFRCSLVVPGRNCVYLRSAQIEWKKQSPPCSEYSLCDSCLFLVKQGQYNAQ